MVAGRHATDAPSRVVTDPPDPRWQKRVAPDPRRDAALVA